MQRFQSIKRKLKNWCSQLTHILKENGSTTDRDIDDKGQEFYEKLYSSNRAEEQEPEIQDKFRNFPEIQLWEDKQVVRKKKDKSART